jgi:hypothetical protein
MSRARIQAAALQEVCDAWNQKHPIGTAVDFFPGAGPVVCFRAQVASAAQVLNGRAQVCVRPPFANSEADTRWVLLNQCRPVKKGWDGQ